jgi:hypothetical protein
VPAGGTATATVTLDAARGDFGAFSGEVTATSSTGPPLRVPVGVVKESTRHILRVHGVDRNGASNVETLVTVINLRDVTASPPDPVLMTAGEATVRVVPGFYTVTAAIATLGDDEPPPDLTAAPGLAPPSVAITTIAEQTVDRDRDVVLDARAALPISAAVRDVPTSPTDVHVFLAVQDQRRNGFVLGYDTSADDVIAGVLFVQPTRPVRHGRFEASSKWRLATSGDGLTPTYDLLFAGPAFPPSLAYELDARAAARLARVETLYRAPDGPMEYRDFRQVFTDINPVSVAVAQVVPAAAPVTRTEYVSTGRDERWFQCVGLLDGEEGVGDFCQGPAGNAPAARLTHDWLRAPLRTVAAASRTPTSLLIGANDLADDGPHGGSFSSHVLSRSYQLYRGDVLLEAGTDPLGAHPVAAGPAVFRLTRTVEPRPDLLSLSTMVSTTWTFRSDPPRRRQASVDVPLLDVAVHLPVDGWNRLAAGVPLPVDVDVTHTAARSPRVTAVTLEISTDDGTTWRALPLRRVGPDRYQAMLPALPASGHLSLRTGAGDAAGNRFEQTILRAAPTPPPPGTR